MLSRGGTMIAMRSCAALALILVSGCLHPNTLECSAGGETWVCPLESACTQPPTYCGTPAEVGACQDKLDNDACASELVADGICVAGVCTSCNEDIAHCRYVGWNPMTSGTTSDITAIAFTKPGEAYAGTASGEIRHYLGSGWTAIDLGMPDVNGVIALQVSGSRVYALLNVVATGNRRVAYLENGTWTALAALTSSAIYTAMWVAPNGEVFLVGALAAVGHFDGMAWSETTVTTSPANQSLNGVWGTSATAVHAVGKKHTILSYDGTAWSPQTSPGGSADDYTAVWGDGTAVIVAGTVPGSAGGTGMVRSVSGGAFAAMPAPKIAMGPRALYGANASDIWAVGNGGPANAMTAVISHWDGVSWTQIQAPTQSPLVAVAGSDADEIFAAGLGGTILRYTGAAWAVLDSPTATSLSDVWAAGPDSVFVVGDGARHLDSDRTWSTTPGFFTAVAGRSATDVVAIGTNAFTIWNGTAFPAATSAMVGGVDLAATASSYFALSDQIYSSPTGAVWTSHALTPNQTGGHGLWVAPSGTFWLASANGIVRADASYATELSTSGMYSAIWGFADDDIYAVGPAGAQHYDGASWTAMPLPTQAKLNGVWGRATDDVFAVGVNQTVLHYHGGLWKPVPPPVATGDLGAISGAGDSVFMTSLDGKVYQLVETAP